MHLATDETRMKHGWERAALREGQLDSEPLSTQSSRRQKGLDVFIRDSLRALSLTRG